MNEPSLMSHNKLRKEKNCLNCGATVEKRFCPECGQENLHPKESFGHLIGHFITDLTHFDNKFFPSIKKLLFSPGFLPNAYAKGQRKKYMNPLSFYLFVSAIFFWLYYTFFAYTWGYVPPEQLGEIKVQVKMAREADIKLHGEDTSSRSLKETKVKIWLDKKQGALMTSAESPYDSVAQYKKAQANLPEQQRDNWWKRYVMGRKLHILESMMTYGGASQVYVLSEFVHLLPKILFVLLPLFALLLTWFFPARSYVENIIFLVYQFAFGYISMFFFFLLTNKLFHNLQYIFFFLPFIYLLIAMYRFYKRDWWLLPKFLLFNIFSLALVFFSLFIVFIYA